MVQVIAKLEGPAVSQYCALRLLQVISAVSSECISFHYFLVNFVPCVLNTSTFVHLQATLDESLYDLAGELVCS